MVDRHPDHPLSRLKVGDEVGVSGWVNVTQDMLNRFGDVTLDPDPLHVEPAWARDNSPYGRTIVFGFLTASLLSHFFHEAMQLAYSHEPARDGHYLFYGFDRMRLIAPVPVDSRIRGRFNKAGFEEDEKGRYRASFDVLVEVDGRDIPALAARWLFVWVPPGA